TRNTCARTCGSARSEPRRVNSPQTLRHRLCIHGLAVELRCDVPQLDAAIDRAFGEFAVPQWPDGFVPVSGTIRPFEQAQVLRHLSSTAAPVPTTSPVLELFQECERFWAIDDCWGICEINLLKGQWQSW